MEELAVAEFQLNKLLHQKEMLDIKRYTNTGGIVAVYIGMSPKKKKQFAGGILPLPVHSLVA